MRLLHHYPRQLILILKFTKEKRLKYISHLDVLRLFQRAFKRAGIKLSYSKGYNPHAKVGFALPLSLVREILPIEQSKIREVGGKETLVVRGEVLPVVALSRLLGWPQLQTPEYGVLMQTAERSFILSVDSFAGRDDAVIKSLDDFRPRGVAGVTTLSNGQIVLILDMKELLTDLNAHIDRELGVRHNRALEFSV